LQNGKLTYEYGSNPAGNVVDSACPFPQDATHFTGQNNTSDLTNEVDPNVWGADCADSKGNIVDIADPTCAHPETVQVQANSAQNYVITNNSPAGNTRVTAYSNVWAHGYNGVLDDYKTLTSSYNITMPINAHTSAWAMQDDWLSEPNSKNSWADYEVMIQYDFTNNGECPSTWDNGANPWGVVANNVMIDGIAWHVCDGQEAHNSDGSCNESIDDACGAMVFKLGATEADRPALTTTSGTIDLKAIFQWLENNNVPGKSYPYIAKGSSISQGISNGWEICSTGGVPEKFYGNGFTVNATH
jgi:hypothetical protein